MKMNLIVEGTHFHITSEIFRLQKPQTITETTDNRGILSVTELYQFSVWFSLYPKIYPPSLYLNY